MVVSEGLGPLVRLRTVARWGAAYFTVGAYTLAAPFGCVAVTVLGRLWRGDPLRRAQRLQRLTCAAYGFMHDWLRLVRICDFDHRGALAGLPGGAFVVVANHPTLMDITSISAALGRGFTVVKGELYRRQLVRPFLEGAGHVAAADADPLSAQRVVDEAVARLADGHPLIVFPEGTRSHRDRLRPFGRTAFEVACRAAVPVVSVTVECEPVYLSKEVVVLRPPDPTARLRLAVLAIDHPRELDFDSRALRDRIEGRYRDWAAARRLAAPERRP
jgi:1-acyl-sn-glycerol-3-phosphate acyltransferase